MREKKTYSSRYVVCSEAMFETGGAGAIWRNPSKTCRTLRGSAIPIGMGSDTFLKISGVFVASRLDPNSQNRRFKDRAIPSATCPINLNDNINDLGCDAGPKPEPATCPAVLWHAMGCGWAKHLRARKRDQKRPAHLCSYWGQGRQNRRCGSSVRASGQPRKYSIPPMTSTNPRTTRSMRRYARLGGLRAQRAMRSNHMIFIRR